MPEENFVMSRNKLIDRLSDMYHTDCLAVADCCDKVLDRSGAILCEVRERHSKIYGTVMERLTTSHNSANRLNQLSS